MKFWESKLAIGFRRLATGRNERVVVATQRHVRNKTWHPGISLEDNGPLLNATSTPATAGPRGVARISIKQRCFNLRGCVSLIGTRQKQRFACLRRRGRCHCHISHRSTSTRQHHVEISYFGSRRRYGRR